MRDNLPKFGPNNNECAIVNLDSIYGAGTHWVAYSKFSSTVSYFDSFGDLPPPIELIEYFHKGTKLVPKIIYNYDRQQNFNTVWCGHLCLKFLLDQSSLIE